MARVVAHVQHDYSTWNRDQSLRKALGQFDDPLQNRYLVPSLYATQVAQYHAMFPPERVLVVDSAICVMKEQAPCRGSSVFSALTQTSHPVVSRLSSTQVRAGAFRLSLCPVAQLTGWGCVATTTSALTSTDRHADDAHPHIRGLPD